MSSTLRNSEIIHTLIERIFGLSFTTFNRSINNLRIRNDNLLRRNNNYFKYKGKVYPEYVYDERLYSIPKLSKSLHEEMDRLLEDNYELTNFTIPYVKAYITSVVLASKNFLDIKLLLDPCLHDYLERTVVNDLSRATVTEDTINLINTNHSKAITFVKEQRATDLILGGY